MKYAILIPSLIFGLLLSGLCLASPDASIKVDGKVTTGLVSPTSKSAKPDKSNSTEKASSTQPSEVKDPTEAIGKVKDAVAAAKEGRWWYFSALVLMLIMFLLKFIGADQRAGFWSKLGRWRYVISPALSVIAALLAAFQGGVSIDTAIGVFTSSYATSSLQELFEHGIMGKPRSGAAPSVTPPSA